MIAGTLTGCAGGQPVTPEALEQAKQLWKKAGIRDYELEWTVAGAQTNHYYVQVRGGEVHQIEVIRPDGTRMHSQDSRDADSTVSMAFS